MLKNLSKFLKSNKDRGVIKEIDYGDRSNYINLLRVESEVMGIQLIYKFENSKKDSMGVYERLDFEGIYDYLNRNFYIAGNYFPYLSNLETGVTEDLVSVDGVNLMRIEQLVRNFKDSFRAEMISTVGTDAESIKADVEEEELKNLLEIEAVKDALTMFMKNKTVADIDMYYYIRMHSLGSFEYSGDTYLQFLGDSKATIKRETISFIKEKSKQIYLKILKTKKIKTEMERLEKDEEAILLRNMLSILNDESRKTLNVVFEKDGKEMSCRIETNRYKHNDDSYGRYNYISEYNIVGPDKEQKKAEFNTFFGGGYSAEGPFTSIKEITYSRRVLYTKN